MQDKTYAGGCHCGAVRFRATPRSTKALACNCSVCAKRAFLHIIVTAEDFELDSGEEHLTSYRFNTGVAEHLFCRVCGVQSFYRPRSHPEDYSVNLRCLDGGQSDFVVESFDGRRWEESIDSIT
jgi:hypothetical protein